MEELNTGVHYFVKCMHTIRPLVQQYDHQRTHVSRPVQITLGFAYDSIPSSYFLNKVIAAGDKPEPCRTPWLVVAR